MIILIFFLFKLYMPFLSVNNNSEANVFNNNTKKGVWLVWYYADWCGHCVNMKPEWEKLEKSCESNNNLNIAKVNSNNMSEINSNMNQNIQGYPTIRLFNNSNLKEEYNGERSFESLLNFLKNNSKVPNKNSSRKSRSRSRSRSRNPYKSNKQILVINRGKGKGTNYMKNTIRRRRSRSISRR